MPKGNRNKPKHKKQSSAKKLAENSKNRVLASKSTNVNGTTKLKILASPTTPVFQPDGSSIQHSELNENWPTSFLENGDFCVETIRSAAMSEVQNTRQGSDMDESSLEVSDGFRHYDVLDELLCEQVDPNFNLVPTAAAAAATTSATRSVHNSFDWEASDEEKIQPSWSEVVLDTQSKLYSAYAKLYTGFWTLVVHASLLGSALANKLQHLITEPANDPELKSNRKLRDLTRKQQLKLIAGVTFNYARDHPYNALFILTFAATFSPVAIIFISIMSMFSILLSLFYVIVFLSVTALVTILIVPLMVLSLSFAAGVMVCGFFSNAFFRFAQVVYQSYAVYSSKPLRLAADQIPPSVGTVEKGRSRRQDMFSKISKLSRKEGSDTSQPIEIRGAEVPKEVLS
ncbi:LAFA_0A07316g1_1 [Lachancea sp. 'fantastica']|nr:LAFA_0A07316g1_1 [Lachancea sp. 'fantastica']